MAWILSSTLLILVGIGLLCRVKSIESSTDECLNSTLSSGLMEWPSSTSDDPITPIEIVWNFDKVCASVSQCYGKKTASTVNFIRFNQLRPVQLRPDQFVTFRLENTDSQSVTFYRVDETGFESCLADSDGLIHVKNDTLLGVANGKLTPGNNYFIAKSINETAFWNCSPYGLRVNITVQLHNCSSSAASTSSSQPCNGNGRCVASRYEAYYSCQCCRGFIGDFCENEDGCLGVVCENGGTCLDGPDDDSLPRFSCSCFPGINGTYCEAVTGTLCDTSDCMNLGLCLRTDDSSKIQCICRHGFTGKVCETTINECDSNPCQYGTCNDLDNGYNCTCNADYSGTNCESYIGVCPEGRCLNDATCQPLSDSSDAVCLCLPGYTGHSCETRAYICRSNLCVNSIDCVDYGDSFKCICNPGFMGTFCEVDVNECASNPCLNGGTCFDHVASFSCVCPEGFFQPMCQTAPDNSTHESLKDVKDAKRRSSIVDGLVIAASVIGCLFGLALLVLLVYCCVVHKPYKRLRCRNKYVHVVDETYGSSSDVGDVTGAHPSPDFVSEPTSDSSHLSAGSAKSPLVRRVKHNASKRI